MLALNIFLTLTACQIRKPTRETLTLSGRSGAETDSYLATGRVLLPFESWIGMDALPVDTLVPQVLRQHALRADPQPFPCVFLAQCGPDHVDCAGASSSPHPVCPAGGRATGTTAQPQHQASDPTKIGLETPQC